MYALYVYNNIHDKNWVCYIRAVSFESRVNPISMRVDVFIHPNRPLSIYMKCSRWKYCIYFAFTRNKRLACEEFRSKFGMLVEGGSFPSNLPISIGGNIGSTDRVSVARE